MRVPAGIIAVLLLCTSALQAATIEQQRDWFKEAKQALSSHNLKQFRHLKAKLQDYPLTPYLDIWHARIALKQNRELPAANIAKRHADIPESIDLNLARIKHLSRRGQWPQVQQIFVDHPYLATRLPETAMVANWRTGNKEAAMRTFSERWQKARTISRFTEPLHNAWLKKGHPVDSERWARIETLARQGKWKQIRKISKPFSKQQQEWLTYWRRVQNDPEKSLAKWPEDIPALQAGMILGDGIKRLSRVEPEKAWHILQQLKSGKSSIPLDLLAELERHTALRAAKRHMPQAAGWLNSLLVSHHDKETRAWQARLAMLEQRWQEMLDFIALLPESEQQSSRWIYWKARAIEALGEPEQARPLFARLATERGYYSFLSAEHLGQPFHLESAGIDAPEALVAEIEQLPGIKRAYEWLQLEKFNKAAREWHFALSNADATRWKAAAKLAFDWEWHDQVIRAAFKARQLDALTERFPTAHGPSVMKASETTGLPPAEIWSIIRQESAFNQHALSWAGARGLMQLMPKTARQVARKLKMGRRTPQLFSPEINIRLGSAYLAEQKKRFGSLALAAAAYNAGPHRVTEWLSRTPFELAEAWVEAIPFNETRRYVQQVMAFVTVYEWRQQKEPSSLIARLNGETRSIGLSEQIRKVSFNDAAFAEGGNP